MFAQLLLLRAQDAAASCILDVAMKIIGPVLVFCAIALTAVVAYFHLTVTMPIYYPPEETWWSVSPSYWLHLLVAVFLLVNILYNYIQTARTPPAYVPLTVRARANGRGTERTAACMSSSCSSSSFFLTLLLVLGHSELRPLLQLPLM